MFQTEHEFILPMGYLDGEGNLHRDGTMRLATAADEILPLKDPRVQKNPSYLVVILMSRVVTKLGALQAITPSTIEGLFAADLAYLQGLYNRINQIEKDNRTATCPQCHQDFELEQVPVGELQAIPSASSMRR
jgi:Zn finger protein HypA/HybF involved in hydrogenase expression